MTYPSKKTKPVAIEVIHMRAWAELRSICLNEEMDKLLKLAEQYDRGERLHDTV